MSESDPSLGSACFMSKRAGERRVKATTKARAISASTELLVPLGAAIVLSRNI